MTTHWTEIENEREKYAAYLCSREWAERREVVRKRANNRCERCLHGPFEACHHLTYERKYNELPEDLQGTCRACHEYTHGKSDLDPQKLGVAPQFEQLTKYASQMLCPICGSADILLVNYQAEVDEQYPPTVSLYIGCSAGQHSFKLRFCSAYGDGQLVVSTNGFKNYT